MKRILYIIAALSTIGMSASAQDNLTMSAKNLPQNFLINPALAPTKSFLSIPIVGGLNMSVDAPFSINEAVYTNEKGVNYLNSQGIIDALSRHNQFNTTINLDIINAGYRINDKFFVGLSVRSRAYANGNIPADAFEMLLDNPYDKYKTFNISTTPDVIGWNEIGASFTYTMDKNWSFGARFKYIAGVASATSSGINFELDKQYDRYVLSGDLNLRGGNVDFGKDGMTLGSIGLNNSGFGVDLGVSYTSDDQKWNGSVSVSDLGFINWSGDKSSQIVTRNPNKKFDFTGMGELQNLFNNTGNIGHLMDSIYQAFTKTIGVDTLKGTTFTTSLPTTFQAMGSYSFDDHLRHTINVGFMGTLPEYGAMRYSISVGYVYRTLNKRWQVMGNYTYRPNVPFGIGVGAVYTSRSFQWFLSTDNIVAVFSPSDMRGANFRLGLNILFNKRR